MQDDETPIMDLIVLHFPRATVTYTGRFEIVIEGTLWPRELRATMQIIDIFKAESKEISNQRKGRKNEQLG